MSIKEIAKMTGASVATVSRVLNNPDYNCKVSGLRDKIWKAAMEINYIPNEAARNLKAGNKSAQRTLKINVLMTRSDNSRTDPFFTEILHVVESELHNNLCILSNVWYYSAFSRDKQSDRRAMDEAFRQMREDAKDESDGLIIIGRGNKEAIVKLKEAFKNIIVVNRNTMLHEVDEIVCDGKKVAALAVEYLIKLGHENIGYVGEVYGEARYEGFAQTLKKNDLSVDADYVYEAKNNEADGFRIMSEILSCEDRPTAFYCSNDIIAVGMLKSLRQHRSRYYVPSIISSDNIVDSEYTKPMLTTVNLPKEEIGRYAVNILLDRIKGGHKNVFKLEIQGDLVIRESCSMVGEVNVTDYYI